ncbi:MAG: pilus assembly protein PilM [Candidatus Omnitrophota bacterium]
MLGLGNCPTLYIGLESLQLIQVQGAGANIKIANLAHVDIFSDNARPSEEAIRNELIVSAIQKAIRKCKLNIKEVYTVLPHGAVLARFFAMPKLPKEEWDSAIRFESKKYIPFRLEEIIADYVVVHDPKQKKIKVVYVAAKIETIKRHIALLAKAGLRPRKIDIIPFALIRAFKQMGVIDNKDSYAIIDINPGMATVVIISEDIPYFIRDISLSQAEEWIDDAAAQTIFEQGVASVDERVKMQESLVSELRLSFDYYQKELNNKPITKIVLCGETNIFDKIDDLLFERLNTPVVIPDVVKYLEGTKIKLQPRFNSIMPISFGAALNKIVRSKITVDMFKVKEVVQVKKKVFMRKLIFTEIMTALICLSLLFLVMNATIIKERSIFSNIEAQRPNLAIIETDLSKKQLEDTKEELGGRLRLYRKIVKERQTWTKKLNSLTKMLPDSVWLTSIAGQDIITKSGISNKDLVLSGVVYTRKMGEETNIINKLIADFKQDEDFYEGFSMLNLTSTESMRVLEYDVMKFEILCSAQLEKTE